MDGLPLDTQRESLLDVWNESGISRGYARAYLAAKYSCSSEELTAAFKASFEASGHSYRGALLEMSGSAISASCFVVIEAETAAIADFFASTLFSTVLASAMVVSVNDCLAIPAFPDAATPNGTFVYATVGGLTGSTEKMDAVELEAATEEMTKKIVELGKSLDTTLEPEELVAAVGVFGSLPTAQFVLSVLGGGGMSIDTYRLKYLSAAKLKIASESVCPSQELRLAY